MSQTRPSLQSLFYPIFSPSRPLTEADCRAAVSRQHQRLPVAEVDPTAITAVWEQIKSTKPKRLFNGLKFRLGAIENTHTDAPTFQLGITDYKTSTGTTRQLCQYAAHVESRDHVSFESMEAKRAALRPYLANSLGVDTLTLTSDGYAVLFKRSVHVGELPGYYNGPSGHAEPGAIFNEEVYSQQTHDKEDDANRDRVAEWFEMVESDVIVHELFHSTLLEVHEELGVKLSDCVDIRLICVAEDPLIFQPNLCFLVRLSLTSAEVRKVFEAGEATDAYEAEEGTLHMVDTRTLNSPEDIDRYLYDHFDGKLCPSSAAALFHGIPFCKQE